jgi:two-component system, OmpR family, phosphate regulon sensor histidine kinase PhoR
VDPIRPLRARLAVRLTAVLFAVTAIGMAVVGFVVMRAFERRAVESVETRLVSAAKLLQDAATRDLAPGAASPRLQEAVTRYGDKLAARVSIIAPDGTVVADSVRDAEGIRRMESQAGQPEVRAALGGRVGREIRRSSDLGVDMLHVAVPIQRAGWVEGVLRLAVPLTEVAEASAWARRTVTSAVVLAFGVALAVGVFINRRVTRRVVELQDVAHGMAEGEFGRVAPATGQDEIAHLGRALNLMMLRLRDKIENLEAERKKVAVILDSMVEGVVALDDRSRILLMNPSARSIFGLDSPEAGAVTRERRPEGRGPEASRPAERGPQARDAPAAMGVVEGRPFLEVIRHKELFDLVEHCRAGGEGEHSRREVELGPPRSRILAAHAVSVAFAPPGRGVLLVIHDVTTLRRLERVKTEFVANVSHELRTPLTAIRGYIETLLDGAIDEPTNARRFLQIANTHAERLGRLVDDLLQLSNIETGKILLKTEPIPLREVVEGIAAMFEAQADRNGVALINDAPESLRAQADRDRLAQILVNLLDNAVKYTPAGGRITLGAEARPTGFVEVCVADTGIGIASTDLPRITERFYRVDKARSRELGGTGLGLAIVKHLVQAQGGELTIESELGKGTTVRFTLPAA